VRITANQLQCVIICVYLPTDNYSAVVSHELTDTLDELETFVQSVNADCVIGGDFNTDFSRSDGQTNAVSSFCKRINIVPHVSIFNMPYSHTQSGNLSSSLLYHFATSDIYAITDVCTNLD
jgi:hypothetical protein